MSREINMKFIISYRQVKIGKKNVDIRLQA